MTAVVFAIFLGLPVLVLVIRAAAGGALARSLVSPAVLDAVGLSLMTTSASLLLTVAIGLPLAFVLARRTFPGKRLAEICNRPADRPPAIGRRIGTAAGVRTAWPARRSARPPRLARLVHDRGRDPGPDLRPAPFFIRSARAGIAGVERDLEDAARVDGASERQVFRVSLIRWPPLRWRRGS